jgi:hypothetical protein
VYPTGPKSRYPHGVGLWSGQGPWRSATLVAREAVVEMRSSLLVHSAQEIMVSESDHSEQVVRSHLTESIDTAAQWLEPARNEIFKGVSDALGFLNGSERTDFDLLGRASLLVRRSDILARDARAFCSVAAHHCRSQMLDAMWNILL